MVGDGVTAQTGHSAVLGRGDLNVHVEVTRKSGGREVLDPVFGPFHRPPGDDGGDDRTDIARVSADLVAETAADVGRDDMDLVLGDLGDQRAHGADACGAWKVPQSVSSPLILSNEA